VESATAGNHRERVCVRGLGLGSLKPSAQGSPGEGESTTYGCCLAVESPMGTRELATEAAPE
jgi:hypothetical protein